MNVATPRPKTQDPPPDLSRPSTEVPALLQHHFDELHAGSGLAVDVIKEQGYRSAWGQKELAPYGFGTKQLGGLPALVLPVHPPDGSNGLAVIKPDHPRRARKPDGSESVIKYEWPAGTRLRLDVPVRCLPRLADPGVRLTWTEGQKKAVAGAQHGECIVSLNGVWAFRDKQGPLPDFARIPHAGRHEVICFDSYVMRRHEVAKALDAFREYLQSLGAIVSLVYLPHQPDGSEMKLDDFLLAHSIDEWRALIGKPPPGVERGVNTFNSFFRTGSSGAEKEEPQERALPSVPDFPLWTLPEKARTLVEQATASCVCPAEFIALPLLAIVGGVIGKRFALYFRRDWVERPILWTAVIGHPGTAKSPGLDRAREPMEQLQKKAYDAAVVAQETYDYELANWTKGSDKPVPPPPAAHYYTSDATAEAINRILGEPRSRTPGLTVIEDELTRWVAAFDAYRGGKGGDRQKWLTLWAGGNLKTDRASRLGEYTVSPVVCVTGGIQPDRLSALAADASARDGFTERFLYAWPDARAPKLGTGEVSEATVTALRAVLEALRGRPEDAQTTAVVNLSAEARQVFETWYDQNADRVDDASGVFQGVYAKLPRQLLRLALVLHALEHGASAAAERVSYATMDAALDLVDYFTAHAFRTLSRFRGGLAGTVAKVYHAYQEIEDPDEGATLSQVHNQFGRNLKGAALRAAVDELCRLGLLEPLDLGRTGPGRPPQRYRTVRKNELNEETPDGDDADGEVQP